MKLKNKVAVVTGGGAGIGRAIVQRFAEEGADVAIFDINGETAQAAADAVTALGRKGLAIQGDMASTADIHQAAARTVNELGRIDVLVNNAGISRAKPFLELTEEIWDQVMDVNLKGPFTFAQAAAKQMVEKGIAGRIINISSVDAEMAYPHNAHYCASKAGLAHLTRCMAVALAPHNITVNCIGPGLFVTEMTHQAFLNPAWQKGLPAKVPLNRLGDVKELAALAAFIASEEASYMTGTNTYLDGGHMLGTPWAVMQMFPAK